MKDRKESYLGKRTRPSYVRKGKADLLTVRLPDIAVSLI
jgi:hypothetical protein